MTNPPHPTHWAVRAQILRAIQVAIPHPTHQAIQVPIPHPTHRWVRAQILQAIQVAIPHPTHRSVQAGVRVTAMCWFKGIRQPQPEQIDADGTQFFRDFFNGIIIDIKRNPSMLSSAVSSASNFRRRVSLFSMIWRLSWGEVTYRTLHFRPSTSHHLPNIWPGRDYSHAEGVIMEVYERSSTNLHKRSSTKLSFCKTNLLEIWRT